MVELFNQDFDSKEGIMPKECCKQTWGKIMEDEPVFILRGQDVLAPLILEDWIHFALRWGVNKEKLERAKQHLIDMQKWQEANPGKCKLPD